VALWVQKPGLGGGDGVEVSHMPGCDLPSQTLTIRSAAMARRERLRTLAMARDTSSAVELRKALDRYFESELPSAREALLKRLGGG
jgi:hypothetical protein